MGAAGPCGDSSPPPHSPSTSPEHEGIWPCSPSRVFPMFSVHAYYYKHNHGEYLCKSSSLNPHGTLYIFATILNFTYGNISPLSWKQMHSPQNQEANENSKHSCLKPSVKNCPPLPSPRAHKMLIAACLCHVFLKQALFKICTININKDLLFSSEWLEQELPSVCCALTFLMYF